MLKQTAAFLTHLCYFRTVSKVRGSCSVMTNWFWRMSITYVMLPAVNCLNSVKGDSCCQCYGQTRLFYDMYEVVFFCFCFFLWWFESNF